MNGKDMTSGLCQNLTRLLDPEAEECLVARSLQDPKTTNTIITRVMEGERFEPRIMPEYITEVGNGDDDDDAI